MIASFQKQDDSADEDESEIEAQIRTLEQYVEELRADVDDLRSAPRLGSIPYLLSYFWQLQRPDTYPVYYTSMRRALSDLAIWEPADDLAETYLQFRALNERMRDILSDYTGEDIHLWDIEHAFYYWQHREEAESEPAVDSKSETAAVAEPAETLPSSYIPPIVSILPDLAKRTEQMIALAEQNGTTVESLFENRLAVCFRILGSNVEDLGQGTERNPDGIFTYRGNDGSYAVIYDAKSSAGLFD